MRSFFVVLALLVATAAPLSADVRFVSPEQGSQVYGPAVIEIATITPAVDRVEFYVDGTLAGVARSAPYRIAWDFGDSLAARKITAHLYSDKYRTRESAEILTSALTASESVDIDLVEVPFRARTSKARLNTADIAIRENGVEQKILELQSSRGATSFYFVVDRSLSMGDGKLQKALAAVDRARTQLRSEDEASVIFFNHRVDAPRKLTSEEKATAKFRSVVPSGGTSLRDALASIHPTRRTIAIVISDGADRNSTLDIAGALQRVARSKLSVYSLLLGGGGGSEFLEAAASRTGATAKRTTSNSLERDMTAILSDINSRYTVVYQSHGTGKGWREIQLLPRQSGIQVAMARRGYYAE